MHLFLAVLQTAADTQLTCGTSNDKIDLLYPTECKGNSDLSQQFENLNTNKIIP